MNFGARKKNVVPMGDVVSKFYLRLEVRDSPGVLASIARIFGECEVSIAGVKQAEATGKEAELVILTHEVREAAMQKAVSDIGKLEVVLGVRSLLRADS
jgi:homoserine dehydrogenase